jgi:hypothetical protein
VRAANGPSAESDLPSRAAFASDADLRRRVERAFDLAETTIDRIVARESGLDLSGLEAPPDKVVAETAMLLRAVAALPDGTVRRCRIAELASQLADYAQSPRIAAGIALHPSLARDYGAAHIVLKAAGFGSPRCDAALARARLADAAQGRERLPHRELEQAWLAWLFDGKTSIAGLAERTALGRGIDLLFGKRDDVYALTHALMYATDFGGAALPGMPRSSDRIAAEADSALAGALDDDDFDLAGELLLTAPYLRRKWSLTASFGFAVLAFVEDEVGVLPSLSLDREGYERHDPASRAAYVTAVAYHTAFVMGLLCAAILRREDRPRLGRIETGAATADRLIEDLLADPKRPQWLMFVRRLDPGRRAALTPFLLDVAIRRAARRLELGKVERALRLGVDESVPATPLRLQAAELLQRLAAASAELAVPGPASALA